MKISDLQNSICIGHVLGDGYLYKDGRLQVEQALKNKNYVQWSYAILSTIASGNISTASRIHPKTNKISYSCRFYTKKVFQEIESLFYTQTENGRKKIIPADLKDLLDPYVLAVWFMDDGGKAQNTPRAAYINVSCFTCKQHTQIQKALLDVFGLKVTIQKAGGNKQYNLYIPAGSYTLFHTLVYPIVKQVPDLMYKLVEPVYYENRSNLTP